MSKVLIKKLGSSSNYRITLPGLVIILVGFAALLPYCLRYDPKAFFILSSVALAGVSLGLLAGPPKFEVRTDVGSVMYGLLAAAVIGVLSLTLHVIDSLSTVRYVILYAAICEELGFRFGAQRLGEVVFGPYVALIFQAGLFMLYHWCVYPGYSLVAAYPLIAGLVLGSVNMVCRDLTPSLIAHVCVNALVAMSLG